MAELFIIDFILIALVVAALILTKKIVRTDRGRNIILIVAPALTILSHYSSLLYHQLSDKTAMNFLVSNPNLLLPIYPCNVVMWCCLIFGLAKVKDSAFTKYLADYIFWFGIISALVGMFANVDFIRNPTLMNYDITKGIVAHGFMLYNILLLPVLGFIKVDLPKNFRNIVVSMAMMFVLGCYCNIVFTVIGSEETAYNVNSMFIIHSPFPDVPFLTFPTICGVAAVAYFGVLTVCELFAYPKGQRWVSRYFTKKKA